MENAPDSPPLVIRGECRNCSAPLTGEFCQQCGQRERDLRLADVAGDAVQDLFDLDSRLWRTLRLLLFKPGQVTADYIAGRRARYIPPIRLYLVVSFLVFLLASVTGDRVRIQSGPGLAPGETAELREGIYVPYTNAEGEREVITLREFLETEEVAEFLEAKPPWLRPLYERLQVNAAILEQDPTVFTDQLTRRIPQMMFVLLPLFALIMMVFLRKQEFHYLQHLIFSLHYHTVAFLMFILLTPAQLLLPRDYGGLVILVLLIFLPLSLKRGYGLTNRKAWAYGLGIGSFYYLVVTFAGTLVALTTLVFL